MKNWCHSCMCRESISTHKGATLLLLVARWSTMYHVEEALLSVVSASSLECF